MAAKTHGAAIGWALDDTNLQVNWALAWCKMQAIWRIFFFFFCTYFVLLSKLRFTSVTAVNTFFLYLANACHLPVGFLFTVFVRRPQYIGRQHSSLETCRSTASPIKSKRKVIADFELPLHKKTNSLSCGLNLRYVKLERKYTNRPKR